MSRTEELRGHAAMLLFSALVAGSFSLGVMIANEAPPVALMAMRFLIAGVVIGVAASLTAGLSSWHARAPWRYLVLGGLFSVYFVLMFEGLKTADPVSASAVFTLTPVMAAGFGWLVLRQVTTPRMALALSIGAAGALWVIFRADVGALLAFGVGRGEAIYFVGCIAHALYAPMVPKLNRGEPPVVFTFGMLVAGFLCMSVAGWSEIASTDWVGLGLKGWAILLYLALFASAATFVLLQYASLRLPAAKVMAYTYLTPSWVILWEIALGRGVPPVLILGGVGLTAIALLLLLKSDARGPARRAQSGHPPKADQSARM